MLDSDHTQRYEAPVLVEPRPTFSPRPELGGRLKGGVPLFFGARAVRSRRPLRAHRRTCRCTLDASPFRRPPPRAAAGVAQLAEHLFCKQAVGGSSPPASSIFSVHLGGLPERPKGAGCKPAGIAYVGSNPTPSTGIFVQVWGGEACASRSNVHSGALVQASELAAVGARESRSLAAVEKHAAGGLAQGFWALNKKSAIARGGIVDHNSRPSAHRGSSSTGRASAFQAERRGFESLLPLYGAPSAQRIGWPT